MIIKLLVLLTSMFLWMQPAQAQGGPAACHGRLFNPLSDIDWNSAFPITVGGVRIGPNSNPPLMKMSPICLCPGRLGIPSPGIGITFWQPLYLAEIERTPGCFSSLGGLNALPGFEMMASEQATDSGDSGGQTSRMQVHFYQYPAFAVMNLFTQFACLSLSGFDLAYMTELDPTWQSDVWAAVFSPESSLFSHPLAQMACAVDAAAATIAHPLDPLFWCAGHNGSVYPLAGNTSHGNSEFQRNGQILAKYLARQARVGIQWQTIGPTAMCSAHPNPIWVKSQYRINQSYPIVRKGKPVSVGSMGLAQFPPATNYPTRESTVNFIWQGTQCCLRF